jgi:uncharacterized protein (TIGR00255 family)
MTGFASVGSEGEDEKVQVTIKSVNHRFLDVALKMPQAFGGVESRVRALIQQKLTRGRVELALAAEVTATPERDVVIDEPLLERVAVALEPLRARGIVSGALSPSDLLRLPGVVEIRLRGTDAVVGPAPSLVARIEEAVTRAIDALIEMRETEGRFLGADLDARLATIARFVNELEREAALGQQALEGRLRDRLADLPVDLQGDAAAVAQEIVRFVSRSDIDEEVVRMRSHLDHWRGLAAGPEPCGRKLDFLVQEMNREINTMGSKVEGARGTEIVIAAKAELERIREQTQNVE